MRNAVLCVAGAVTLAWGYGAPARAGISFVDMYRTDAYTQTGDSGALTYNGSYLSTRLFSTGANEYSAVQATFSGPASPAPLVNSADAPAVYSYDTGFYPSRAALNADFPAGTFMYSAMKASATDIASFVYSGDAYALTLPYLAGSSYSSLQGANANASLALQFSGFTSNAAATEADLFFTVFDYNTGAVVYDAGFLPSTTTGLTLAANTLQPNTAYAYQLIFSNRRTAASTGATFDATVGNDLSTTGFFTTAVPEPSSFLLLMALGGAGLFAARRRSRLAAACG